MIIDTNKNRFTNREATIISDNKEEIKMKKGSKKIIVSLFLSVCLLLVTAGSAYSEGYEALNGLTAVKAVFDFRVGNPKSALLQLDLLNQTFKDKGIRAAAEKPEFVIVFIGPSVKLISSNREGFSAEDQKTLDEIAALISKMSKEGIKLEACMFAAKLLAVDPASILPEIEQVGNGWISLIGYQAKGYSIVPAY
jgi:intracellular sulfur oxidation DsrE/DsrF family protein